MKIFSAWVDAHFYKSFAFNSISLELIGEKCRLDNRKKSMVAAMPRNGSADKKELKRRFDMDAIVQYRRCGLAHEYWHVKIVASSSLS